ncbi:AfsR/SARP family transcriptional regulator [Streptomyces sp. TRM64462]|uniref:AfsR/SARP family transcriptional regulator n=1 Tax=Streptomyces sp. TRM64462 TaxID=2741726 RepID=UPI001C306FA8|nr:AfsR/SARP family transcriptional regulator [Streptomyces sp. TRM64462]
MLGPVEVLSNGSALSLGGVIQRAALGYLLLNSNKVVATSAVVRAVWGHDAPPTARKMVQNAVSRLRRTLGDGGDRSCGSAELLTSCPGYQLNVDPDAVDLLRFRKLADRGRAELAGGFEEQAARDLGDALNEWRGPALGDLTERGISWPQMALLENERLSAVEDRAEARLALGRHFEVVHELEALVEAEPTRERLCGQLMLALYRCHRQREALMVYQRTRMALVDGYGLDPSRQLQELEVAILQHAPSLTAPGRPAAVAGAPAGAGRAAASPVRAVHHPSVGGVPPHLGVPARDRNEEAALASRWRGRDPLWTSLW